MAHITPFATASENKKTKKESSGPRADTLALIRQFARVYEFEPTLQPLTKRGYLVN